MLTKSKVKYIQSLGQKKFRKQERVFVAEGPKVVKELLEEATENVKAVYATKEWLFENQALLENKEVFEVSAIELEKISHLSSPNQVVAVVQQFSNIPVDVKNSITLVLDDVQDPGNMGTIIRIADWFGVNQIICSMGSADVYNPKVIQSTMGSIARVNIVYADIYSWVSKQNEVPVYAAVLGGKDIALMKKIDEGIIIIGNESKGISSDIVALANERISITKKGKAESLNAAVACGIILAHFS